MARMNHNRSRTFRMTHTALIAGALTGLAMLSGCVSYTNVPEPVSAPAFESANHSVAKIVTSRALAEVIRRYPMKSAQGQYAINLPAGTSLESAREIINGLPDGAVIPFEGMDSAIPTYHIGRIWIRASDAKVDVIYPAKSFTGEVYDGNVTVWLNGGVRRWRTHRVQHWAPGTIAVPPIYVPIPEDALEAQESAAQFESRVNEPEPMPEPESTNEQPMQAEPEPMAEKSTPEPVVESEPEPTPSPSGGAMYREIPVDD
jgi:hypothetical protein